MGDYVEKQRSCFISVTLESWSGRKLLDPTTYLSGLEGDFFARGNWTVAFMKCALFSVI